MEDKRSGRTGRVVLGDGKRRRRGEMGLKRGKCPHVGYCGGKERNFMGGIRAGEGRKWGQRQRLGKNSEKREPRQPQSENWRERCPSVQGYTREKRETSRGRSTGHKNDDKKKREINSRSSNKHSGEQKWIIAQTRDGRASSRRRSVSEISRSSELGVQEAQKTRKKGE